MTWSMFPICAPAKGQIVGRSVAVADEGNTSFTIGLPGGAAVNGVDLYVILVSNGSTALSGTWTELDSGGAGRLFHRRASSEPSSYTIDHSGGTAKDSCSAILFEVIRANVTNPEAHARADGTGVLPGITTSHIDLFLLFAANQGDTANFTTPPAGYTQIQRIVDTGTPPNCVAAAFKTNVAPGTPVNPGTWSPNTITGSASLYTVGSKP